MKIVCVNVSRLLSNLIATILLSKNEINSWKASEVSLTLIIHLVHILSYYIGIRCWSGLRWSSLFLSTSLLYCKSHWTLKDKSKSLLGRSTLSCLNSVASKVGSDNSVKRVFKLTIDPIKVFFTMKVLLIYDINAFRLH